MILNEGELSTYIIAYYSTIWKLLQDAMVGRNNKLYEFFCYNTSIRSKKN